MFVTPLISSFLNTCIHYIQVAFAYLEHIAANGEVDVETVSKDGGVIVVAAGEECMQQSLAYRDQAKTMVENMLNILARDKVACSPDVRYSPHIPLSSSLL